MSVPIATNYQQAYADLSTLYWDATSQNGIGMPRIRPTDGSGLLLAPNGDSFDGSTTVQMWQIAQYHTLLYSHWRVFKDSATAQKITQNWAAVKAMYPGTTQYSGLGSDGSQDGTVGLSDDGGWILQYLCQVHEVTGDSQALSFAVSKFANLQARFADKNNPKPYGALACSAYGMLYAQLSATYDAGQAGVSTMYEVTYALASLYISQHASVSNPSDYLAYAVGTWGWIQSSLRSGSNSYNGAAGYYFCDLDIKKYTLSGSLGNYSYTNTANTCYLKPVGNGGSSGTGNDSPAIYGPPVRANSASYSGGTMAMAVLSARLYQQTSMQMYLTECRSIAQAFWQNNAFGRTTNLTTNQVATLLVNERDPYTAAQYHTLFVLEALGLSGVDSSGNLKTYLSGTASNIVASCVCDANGSPYSGIGTRHYSADWSGKESNTSYPPNANTTPTLWQSQYNASPGSQAGCQQITTQSNTVLSLLAGAVCLGMSANDEDASEVANGLQSDADKRALDDAEANVWSSTSSSVTSGSGSFGSGAVCNCSYIEHEGVVVANFQISIPNIGSAAGYIQGNLPVTLDPGANVSAEGAGIDFGVSPNAPLTVFTVSQTQFRIVPSANPSGSACHAGSYIKFTLRYRGAN